MRHEDAPRKERLALSRQFGNDTIMPRQMGDTTMSPQEQEKAKDNFYRGMRTEDHDISLQMS